MDTGQERIIILRDPFGFTPAILRVSQHAFYIISLLDGTRDVRDVQAQFMRQFGELLYTEKIEDLLERLDSCHFLDNERYAALRDETIKKFLESPTRPASHAGQAYPDKEADLLKMLAGLFKSEEGVRRIDWDSEANTIRGLIVPHIDFERGGPCYGLGYAELAENSRAETYVVLGTAHCEMKKPFCLTLKGFETPLGTVPNDREFGEELLEHCPWLTEDEFSHRSEHSIEFQAVFLQHLFGRRREIKIVPILCGAFHRQQKKLARPGDNPDVAALLEALKAAVSKRTESVCLIAGADLSHVGLRFGDGQPVNDRQLAYLEEQDIKTVEHVLNVDAQGFYENVTSDGDRRRICGLPNIYAMLHVLGTGRGRLLKYMQAPDKAAGSVVTFASVVIEK